jgi:undecaprenyl-diphosphatase
MRTPAQLGSIQEAVLRRVPRRESLDARAYMAINRLPHTGDSDEYITLISDLGKGAGWVAAGIWLLLRDGRRGRRAGIASTGAMFAAIALVQGPAKAVFRRRRPFAGRLAVVVGVRPLDTSFPSGHTAGSFAAATALASFYPKDGPLLMLMASLVGVSRVYLGHHFPSDVIVGAGLGGAVGRLAARLTGARGWNPRDAIATVEDVGRALADHGDSPRAGGGPARTIPDRSGPLVESEQNQP